MVGGYKNKSRGYGFKEEEVDINIIKLEKEIESYQNKLNITEKKRLENETILIKLRETKVELEAEIIQLEKTLGLNETNLEKLRSEEVELEEKNKLTLFEQKQIEEKIIKLNSELLESKGIKNKIREKLSNPTITKKLEELESKKLLMKSDAIEIVAHIKNFDLQVSSVFGIELSKSFNILKQHEKEFEEFSKENLNLKEILKERQKELKEKENIEKKYYGQFKESILKRNKLEEKIQQREVAVLKEEERINSIQQKANNTSIEKAKINAEIEGLNKEKEVSKIGSVNLRALEVYEDIEKELNTLLEKVTKLRTEKDDVLVMVFEIEDKKKSTFIKTYNKVDKTFKDIFKSLTTKGEAHMELENPDNIFDAGIDFKVKVTGNKFLDLKSLSGGEKTMCALAFIFALQEFEPSPFYLLDEVDAALDKINSELLSKLIKKYAEKSQYIVVSHNDTVINEADQIYGVSMQDGISKVISLKI